MAARTLVHRIVLAWGWRRAAIAFVAGALSVLALAPFDVWPVLFVTLPVMVWLIDGSSAGRFDGIPAAAWAGWWFGFGYFLAGLYWIGYAFLVDADTFGWLLPFAVTLLPAGLAVFWGFGFALARLLWTRDAWRIVSLAIAMTAAEWLRGHVLSGFPWNTLGYGLAATSAFAQAAAYIGLWGLTFLALVIFASPAIVFDDRASRFRYAAPLCALIALAGLAIFGAMRLAAHPTTFVENVQLRVIQPNVSQDEKFNYGAKAAVMKKYLDLSDRATGPRTTGVRDVTVLIWPESAFPFFLTRESDALAQIADLLPKGTTLITGGVRPPLQPPGQPITRAYNSVYVIGDDGSILATYDKLHLVPFGEYLPFQATLERLGLLQLTKLRGGYIAGRRRHSIKLPHAPAFIPLVCYEVIFPGDVTSKGDRPRWIVNLTNDGWFSISTGPYQHLQQARLRAIEEGLPIVRAANTGISAIIDPLGRVAASLDLGSEGVLDGGLPEPLPPTAYTRYRDGPLAVVLALGIIIVLRRRGIWIPLRRNG